MISAEPGVQLEYFDAVDANNLHTANEKTSRMAVLVAAKVGNTRLIDNIILNFYTRTTRVEIIPPPPQE